MLLPLHEFREEMRHLETEYGALYLQELQRVYWQSVQQDKMDEKLAAFRSKIEERLN